MLRHRKKDYDAALADYTEALRLKPDHAGAFDNRAYIREAKGDLQHALADLDEAVRISPKHSSFRLHRGGLLSRLKQFAHALADYSEAVDLDPGSSFAQNSLAWFLATCPDPKVRDGRRAVAAATRACELTQWKNTDLLDTLAAAHAEAGDFDAAVTWETKALGMLAPDNKKDRENFRARIDLYRAMKPYREGASNP
jgi:tetratricopeptide (TPR) repeat protein